MSCAHDSSGYYVWGSQDVTLARCQGEDNAVGMYQGGSVAVSILDSVFTRNVGGLVEHLDDQEYPGTGILLGNFSRGCVVDGNHVHGNRDWGLGVSLGVSEVEVRRNRFADNRVGVFAGTRGLALNRNDIVGNSHLGVDAAAQCDARRNWWGDPSGPSGAGPGSGDGVTPAVAVEPWLEAPVETIRKDASGP
jgi:nitrous oxidase accessory protein NosD